MNTPAASFARTVALGLVLSLLSAAVLAQERAAGCELGDYDPVQRPDLEGTPTEVGIGVYVVQLDRVDNVDESFRLDGFFTLAWRDARLAAVVRGWIFPTTFAVLHLVLWTM